MKILVKSLHEAWLEKANKGEGSRGGKVIGHTKSGKPIYADRNHHEYDSKAYGVKEHLEAAKMHKKLGNRDKYEGHLWSAAKRLGHTQGIFSDMNNEKIEKMLDEQINKKKVRGA